MSRHCREGPGVRAPRIDGVRIGFANASICAPGEVRHRPFVMKVIGAAALVTRFERKHGFKREVGIRALLVGPSRAWISLGSEPLRLWVRFRARFGGR
jgi:hypothetical protein